MFSSEFIHILVKSIGEYRMYQTSFKSILIFSIVAISQVLNANACKADAICPHTYLFALDGLHYYSAVRCSPIPCTEVVIETLLIYNQRITHFGCEPSGPNAPVPDCKCKTSLIPVGTYNMVDDLSKHYDPTGKVYIRNDHFVSTQIGNQTVYFRTLTFVSNNGEGVAHEQSIAVPIDQNSMRSIMQHGLGGSQVIMYSSAFDGWNVLLGDKRFRALLANYPTNNVNNKSVYSK